MLEELQQVYKNSNAKYLVNFHRAFYDQVGPVLFLQRVILLLQGGISIITEFLDCGSLLDIYRATRQIPEDILAKVTVKVGVEAACDVHDVCEVAAGLGVSAS